MMKQQNSYISIGKILNFHGTQGEAKVGYSKNLQDYLKSLKSVLILQNDEYTEYNVKSVRFNNKFAIIKFDGINNINEILELKGSTIFVPQDDLKETLSDDEFLVNDLVGMDVYSADKKVGVVVGLSNNGATDLLSIRSLSKNISLVPFVKDLVPEVDIENKKIFINEIEGLIE